MRHFHGVLRLLINVAVSYIFCWLAGWGATHVQFFEGFNYSPMLTLDMPGTHAGSVCAVALVVFPMLLCPLSPLLNLAHASCSTTRTCTPRASRDSTR